MAQNCLHILHKIRLYLLADIYVLMIYSVCSRRKRNSKHHTSFSDTVTSITYYLNKNQDFVYYLGSDVNHCTRSWTWRRAIPLLLIWSYSFLGVGNFTLPFTTNDLTAYKYDMPELTSLMNILFCGLFDFPIFKASETGKCCGRFEIVIEEVLLSMRGSF